MNEIKQLPDDLHRDDLFCYAFSVDQRAGHVDQFWHYLKVNLEQVVTSSTNDYKLLYLGTNEECHAFGEVFSREFLRVNP